MSLALRAIGSRPSLSIAAPNPNIPRIAWRELLPPEKSCQVADKGGPLPFGPYLPFGSPVKHNLARRGAILFQSVYDREVQDLT
jgi:hypothetical protein